ncbi:LPS-assembly protein LptD [Caulobacter sp. S45]|uniref:LPS-assembly protein LptD n=1 Tax=Caulobacter sp. S45 TaxID=1641861 RepID=UPI001575748D|nr:LPS assembly protein LptD [Caulobacter sp. S45]
MRQGALRDPGSGGPAPTGGWAQTSCKALLLAGAAALACHSTANAQLQGTVRSRAAPPPLADDGLGPRDLLLEADSVAQDQPKNLVTATGHVQARYQGKTLRADSLVYNTATGAAHAFGHAVVVNPDGSTIYGDDVTLDDQFRAAVALGFATRQVGNTTLTAGVAVRRNETVNQLNNAVYTACNICALDGRPTAPTWSISASRIIEDRQNGVIYYRNAVIRVLGIPIFYAPVFWHPDPTTPRRSGLLAPKIEYSRRRGFSYQQPYLFAVNPSTDFVVSPQINSRVNPFLNVRYTERFYSGMIDIRAGYTYSKEFNNQQTFDNDTSRSYILARGLFDVTPDKNWVWGFGAERTTDPTLFQRYGITNVYTDRGPFPADTDRLISQVYTVRADDTSYFSLAALDFQSLRAYGNETAPGPNNTTITLPQGIFETSKSFPIVGPLIEARFNPTDEFLGGQLRLQASAVALTRNDPVLSVFDPNGVIVQGPQLENNNGQYDTAAKLFATGSKQISALSYTDSRRASLGGDWQSTFTLDNGIRIQPFVFGRGDFYSITDAQVYNPNTGNLDPGKSTVERISGTAGANLSWPFIKPIGSASIVLEPLAQLDVSPVYKVNPNIPNEDSASFEYDETNLFSIDRFSGFDLLEGGQRINVGGRGTIDWGSGQNASLLVGRTFRAQDDPQFTTLSGLQGADSDWVVAATSQPIPGLSLFTRSRLDKDSFALHREEAGVSYGSSAFSASVRYDLNESGLQQISPNDTLLTGQTVGETIIGRTEDIQVGGFLFFTRHWGVSANVSRDLQQNLFPIAQVGLIYDNECVRVDVLYTRDETYGNVIGNSNSITFRISLSTLGGTAPLAPTNSRGSR